MSDLGRFEEGGVRFERHLAAPPAQVWEHLTRSDLLADWLGSGEVASEVGGPVELRSGGPVIRGTVRDYDPARLLSYSWTVFLPGDDRPVSAESMVQFRLAPDGEATVLTASQTPVAEELLLPSAAGWHALLDTLAAAVAGEAAPDFMQVVARVQPEYARALGITEEGE